MKAVTPFIMLTFFCSLLFSQIKIEAGAGLKVSGKAQLVLDNMDWEQSGTFLAGESKVRFQGSLPTTFSGNTTFHQISIEKDSSKLSLANDIEIQDSLSLLSGNLNLNGQEILLGRTGKLIGERESSRVYSSAPGGILSSEAILNSPNGDAPGQLGLQIYSTTNLDSVFLIRGHDPQSFPAGDGIRRYFDLKTKNPFSATDSLTFSYLEAELNGIAESDLMAFQSPDSGVNWSSYGSAVPNLNNNVFRLPNLPPASAFRWTLSTNQVLPVEWLDFQARLVGEVVRTQWTTASEVNTHYFEVERSLDGNHFERLAQVAAQGRSRGNHSYESWDKHPLPGISYYRIKQVDLDGSFSYSRLRQVELSNSFQLQAGPNPFTSDVQLSFFSPKAQTANLSIYNLEGKLVKKAIIKVQSGNNQVLVDLTSLARGNYFLSFSMDDKIWGKRMSKN